MKGVLHQVDFEYGDGFIQSVSTKYDKLSIGDDAIFYGDDYRRGMLYNPMCQQYIGKVVHISEWDSDKDYGKYGAFVCIEYRHRNGILSLTNKIFGLDTLDDIILYNDMYCIKQNDMTVPLVRKPFGHDILRGCFSTNFKRNDYAVSLI